MKKTGIELIAQERKEQIEKHGRTVEQDSFYNQERQLINAAVGLIGHTLGANMSVKMDVMQHIAPLGWDKDVWQKMCAKSKIDRLTMAGALIAAEIDRLQAIGEE